MRRSLSDLVKAFASLTILGPLLAFAGWTIGLTALAHSVGLWETDVRNDTVYWFVTVGFAFFLSLRKVTEGRFFRTTARHAVAITALVEGFANLAVFGLAVELVLLPTLIALGAMAVVS